MSLYEEEDTVRFRRSAATWPYVWRHANGCALRVLRVSRRVARKGLRGARRLGEHRQHLPCRPQH